MSVFIAGYIWNLGRALEIILKDYSDPYQWSVIKSQRKKKKKTPKKENQYSSFVW